MHPAGNPHIQTDPRNIARVAAPLAARLAELDPANAAYYQARYKAFAERWTAAIAQLGEAGGAAERRADRRAAQGVHLSDRLARHEGGRGARAQARHRADDRAPVRGAGDCCSAQPAKMVLRAAYQSDRASQWIAERAKINAVALPFTVGGDDARQGSVRPVRRHDRAPAEGGAMNLGAIDLSILLPALVAGLLVTATHVPLGMQVLARGIVFIDLAIAQIAGCGVLLADRFGFEAEGIAVQVAALAAALGGALLLTWTERVWPDVQEAVIGVVFVLGATGSVLLLASNVARQRASARPARRPDPLGAAAAARVGRGASTRRSSRCGSAARAPRPHRLLRAVRARGHRVGAARRACISCSRR